MNGSDGETPVQLRLLMEQHYRKNGIPADALLRMWAVLWPELGDILEEGRVRRIDELLPERGPCAYWERMRGGTLWGILANREWLQQERLPEIVGHVQLAKNAIEEAKECLGALDVPPTLPTTEHSQTREQQLEASLLDSYVNGLTTVLGYAHTNRLIMLSEIEHHIHRHGEGPSMSYYDFFDSLAESAGRGRPVESGKRRRRKKLVVKLLEDEPERHKPYRSPEDFFMDIENEDDDWNSVRAVRSGFQRWLGEQMPDDMEGWRAAHSFWTVELELGVDSGQIPPIT